LSKLVKRFLRYHNFLIIQDGGHCHLGFQKFSNFISWEGPKRPDASPCQILSKSINPLWSYSNFSIFNDGGHPPSWICL